MIKQIISLSDLTGLKTDKLLKASILPLLEKNQVVDAKVLQLISPSKAELLIMGKKVLADTSVALTKGETIQLKVTDQGKLTILKVMPDRINPSGSSNPTSGMPASNAGLSSLSDSALQFFAKNQPFEGFTKLAQTLFSTTKEILVLKNGKSVENAKGKPVGDVKGKPVEDIKVKPVEDIKVKPVEDIKVKPVEDIKIKPVEDIKVKSVEDIKIKPVEDIKVKPVEDIKIKSVGEKEIARSLSDKVSSPVGDKGIVKPQSDQINKPATDKGIVKPQFDQMDKPATAKGFIKLDSDQMGKPVLDKEIVTNQLVQIDKSFADKEDIKNMLMSVALKSEKTDIDFLPRLLQKSGMLLEKTLSDMISNAFPSKHSINSSSGNLSDSHGFTENFQGVTEDDHSFIEKSGLFSGKGSALPDSPTINNQPLLKLQNLVHEDIKAAVLNFMANSGSESSEDIKVFHEFVQNLENVQLLNSHLSESGKYIIPFPMFSGDQFSFGQLLIDLGQKENDDKSSSSKENSLLKVSLFLDMTRLGPIRADFSVLKNNITGGFQVSNEETAAFFRTMLPELNARLQSHDYNVHKIDCRVVEPEKLAEKSIINELLKSEDHGFSVMI
ncbi:MAG: flagellar hook-length control protein FliK [Desulfamplus sp.]|nr:flagellar hook-length control protein FliK [Desulfamplus sp.]